MNDLGQASCDEFEGLVRVTAAEGEAYRSLLASLITVAAEGSDRMFGSRGAGVEPGGGRCSLQVFVSREAGRHSASLRDVPSALAIEIGAWIGSPGGLVLDHAGALNGSVEGRCTVRLSIGVPQSEQQGRQDGCRFARASLVVIAVETVWGC